MKVQHLCHMKVMKAAHVGFSFFPTALSAL